MSPSKSRSPKLGSIKKVNTTTGQHNELKEWVKKNQPNIKGKKQVKIPELGGNAIIFVDEGIPDDEARRSYMEKLRRPIISRNSREYKEQQK